MSANTNDLIAEQPSGASRKAAEAEAEYGHLVQSEYEHGFVTQIESDTLPPGLDESVIATISQRKGVPSWMLDWRLAAYA